MFFGVFEKKKQEKNGKSQNAKNQKKEKFEKNGKSVSIEKEGLVLFLKYFICFGLELTFTANYVPSSHWIVISYPIGNLMKVLNQSRV